MQELLAEVQVEDHQLHQEEEEHLLHLVEEVGHHPQEDVAHQVHPEVVLEVEAREAVVVISAIFITNIYDTFLLKIII